MHYSFRCLSSTFSDRCSPLCMCFEFRLKSQRHRLNFETKSFRFASRIHRVRNLGFICFASKKDTLSEVSLDPENLDPVVSQVMNRDVIFLTESQTVRDAIQIFLSSGISGAPVLNQQKSLIGVLSETDIIRREAGVIDALQRATWSNNNLNIEQLPSEFKKKPKTKLLLDTLVKDVMTKDPISISEDMLIVEAAILMINSQVNRLPVVKDGKVVGVLSRGDILQCMIWEILIAGSSSMEED